MTENKNKNNIALDWIDGTIPKSIQFDDTYYSKSDGFSETQFVFINGNNLANRWIEMPNCTIAELGFGTGLNFLTTIEKWTAIAPPRAKLHFISFEQFPIKAKEIEQALSHWPQLNDNARKLADHWNTALQPSHNRPIDCIEISWSENIQLTVHIGDANEILPKQSFNADAWYLDGFSPSKNPELWSLNLMKHVYQRTVSGGTFATYTSAGWVRRNLMEAGFNVHRVPGHAGKRQMSIGHKG